MREEQDNCRVGDRVPLTVAPAWPRRSFIGHLLTCTLALAVVSLFTVAHAQFGPPTPQGRGPKLPAPTAFPPSGTFPTTESVTLLDGDASATIHYTLDGSVPTAKSAAFDPKQLLFIAGFYEGDTGVRAAYTIRAVAIEDGRTNSDVSDFEYVIDRRDRTAYVSEEILPGVRMIRDSENDKMYLTCGSAKCLLIDSGLGRGDLKAYLSQFTGGLPIVAFFTHNHGDHIGQADQFVRDSLEYIGEPDRAGLERTLKSHGITDDVIAKNVVSAHDGDRIDIGGRSFVMYAAPGHTPGSMVILDEQKGILFTGDAFGNNSPIVPNTLWMQFDPNPLDEYWTTIKSVRSKVGDRMKYMVDGHDDHPLDGEAYLNNLESALRELMDEGDAALVPSYRPAGLMQVVVGDRFHDPNWAAINVNHDHYLPAPVDRITSLTWIAIDGAKLVPDFSPAVKDYAIDVPRATSSLTVTVDPTSDRSTVTIDGDAAGAGKPQAVKLPVSRIEIGVRSPDGTETASYTVTVNGK
jgi:glyoxylase-like metal-dependent hydrolase (beta-lactamase superfamily II)